MFIRPDFKTVLVLLFFYLLLAPLSVSASGYWWQRSGEGCFSFFIMDASKEKEEKKPRIEKKLEVQLGPLSPLFTDQMKRKGEELLSAVMENPNFVKGLYGT